MAAPDDLMQGLKELSEAVDDKYQVAADFYEGNYGDVFASPRVRRLLAKMGTDEVEDFQYAAIPVDSIAKRLKILAVSAVRPDREQEGESREQTEDTDEQVQEVIDGLIKDNKLRQEWHGLHHGASEYGDYYLHVWPVADEGGQVLTVEMLAKDPMRVMVLYDQENPLEKRLAIESWEIEVDGQTRKRVNLWYADRVERWITVERKAGKSPDEWEHYAAADDQTGEGWQIDYPAGLDEVPFFHFRTSHPYGDPEHKRAFGPQRMINKLVSAHAASIDFQVFPQRYMLMDPAMADRMSNLVDPDFPEDEDDDPESPDGTSQFSSDPSAIWRIWAKAVGEFPPASPQFFLEPIDRYVRSMSELTGIPLFRFGIGGTPSGEALRVEKSQETETVLDRQEAYEAVHEAAFSLALRLLGYPEVQVRITWKPVTTIDDAAGWQMVQQKTAAGVPIRQALIEAGYLEEEVDDWLDEPGSAVMLQRMALMSQIGTFIQAASAGVATGVVSSEMVRQVVDMVLGANQTVTQEQLESDGTMPKLPPKPEPPAPPPAPGGALPAAGNGRRPVQAGAAGGA